MKLLIVFPLSVGFVLLLVWAQMMIIAISPDSSKQSTYPSEEMGDESDDAYISLDNIDGYNKKLEYSVNYVHNLDVVQPLKETPNIVQNLNVIPIIKESLKKDDNRDQMRQNQIPEDNSESNYKNKILIFTSYRTGSTFTGELLKQNPDVFYLFEPLKLPSLLSRDNYLQEHIVEYLDDCFNCKFSGLVQDSKKFYPVEKSMRRAWYLKIFDQPIQKHGYASLFPMEKVCRQYNLHAIKIIRGNRIQSMFPLMEKGVKVIHLIRDPRGTITSRLQIESLKTKKTLESFFKEAKTMNSIKSECLRYSNTYELLVGNKLYIKNQKDVLRKQYRLVRYEDIAYNPEKIAQDIYAFLNLSMPNEVSDWLSKSTSGYTSGNKSKILSHAYSTSRNSSATAEAWRNKMPFPINLEVQRICGNMLRNFGYRRVYSRTEYTNLHMSLIREMFGNLDNVIK